MHKYYKILELDKILKKLAEETSCQDAYEQALSLEPMSGLFEVREQLELTKDAHMLTGRFGGPSFGGIKNVVNGLKRASAGGVLTSLELIRISETLRVVRGVKEWKNKSAEIKTTLDMFFERLTPNKHLEDQINRCIIAEDEFADSASPALHEIRRKIRSAAARAHEILEKIIHSTSYQKYLQESIVTQRSGRYVVPVKAEHRNSVQGLVHDTSGSGATVFIEPMGVVQANNDIKVLKSKEDAEIERILFELSSMAGSFADTAIESYKLLTELNVIFAKASLGYKMKAFVPQLNDKGTIQLKQARHPLIDSKRVVAADIVLGNGFHTLVITGPNTGGKTVALKTIGLMTLMAMCGLMIPAEESSMVSVFDAILVDIGDEQSIEQSLSTFSAHMTNIIGILKEADQKSLVLIDELGAGTDPVEGAALATAILEQLGRQGSKIACTTHYAELKMYALETFGVENGCCEFDVATLKPTYKLLIGIPGKSNAFAISQRLGMPSQLIQRAESLVSTENRRFEDVVETLECKRQDLEERLSKAQLLMNQAESLQIKNEEEKKNSEEQRQKVLEQARMEAESIVSKAQSEAYALLDKLEQAEKDKKQLTIEEKVKLRQDIKQMEKNASSLSKKVHESYTLPRLLKAGDEVLICDINKRATVLEIIENSKSILVQAGIIKTRVDINNIRLLDSEKSQNYSQYTGNRTGKSKIDMKAVTDIDVRGMTASEALIEVDKVIDNAVLMGINQLTIIHGKGTGVLRREVHVHLKQHKAVKSFRLGLYGEGETGVTIVTISDEQ